MSTLAFWTRVPHEEGATTWELRRNGGSLPPETGGAPSSFACVLCVIYAYMTEGTMQFPKKVPTEVSVLFYFVL